jgi:hypothetical protein
VFVDAVAVAPAVFGLVHVSGLHEVGDDAIDTGSPNASIAR